MNALINLRISLNLMKKRKNSNELFFSGEKMSKFEVRISANTYEQLRLYYIFSKLKVEKKKVYNLE